MTKYETEEIIDDIDRILRDIEKIENIKIVGNEWGYHIENATAINPSLEDVISDLQEAKIHLREQIDEK